MKTAVIYTRLAPFGDLVLSQQQATELQAFADAEGINVLRSFIDDRPLMDISHKELSLLWECLEFCKKHQPDLLLVPELSSLGDMTAEVLSFLSRFNDAGISVYIVNLGLQTLQDGATPKYVGSVLIPVITEVLRLEKARLVEQQAKGRAKYVMEGGRLGRPSLSSDQMAKKYPGVYKRLNKGQKIAEIARQEEVSISTVKKVKRKTVSILPDFHGGMNDLMWTRLGSPEDDQI